MFLHKIMYKPLHYVQAQSSLVCLLYWLIGFHENTVSAYSFKSLSRHMFHRFSYTWTLLFIDSSCIVLHWLR